MSEEITPARLLQLGSAFWASKAFLSAVELGVFTELAKAPRTLGELETALGLHPRSSADFLDGLVALGVLERRDGLYANSPDADFFLDRAKPSYMGGIFEMLETRLYGFWGGLTEGLRTGRPQNEIRHGGEFFEVLYSDPKRLRGFLQAMTGVSMGAAKEIAAKFPWTDYRTMFDVGGAQGAVPVQVALAHPHLTGGCFDLPMVGPVFEEYVRSFGLEKRLRFEPGDFFRDPMPKTDVIVMGHILHDWSLEEKKTLLEKSLEAVPDGGAVIVYEAIIDDDRRQNVFGLMMSLNMLIETEAGFDYTGADCQRWMREVGFRETRVEPLVGPDSMVIGIK